AHLFFDAGDIGMRGRGGHGHLDTLSFELWAHGAPLIVDSGTYAYTFDPKARKQFQSVRAHNTIIVDGREPAEFVTLWGLRADQTRPRVLLWEPGESPSLEAEYHCGPSIVHRRRVLLTREPFRLEVTDKVYGNGTHDVELFLHFHPDVAVSLKNDRTALAITNTHAYSIQISQPGLSLDQSFYSPSYGIKVPNSSLRLSTHSPLPLTLTTSIHGTPRPQK
ncbi:MAG: heparinase II/III-family protein, partial [Ignavibacteriales bacterium]|nr:heparinase II/III-family protein [Ignavibacteriales bacterium]